MGVYLNPGTESFTENLSTEPYVDKSLLIAGLNRNVSTRNKYICVSRPRRFGKTMALNMLAAYYGKCGSAGLFDSLRISSHPSYREHIGKYNVIKLNMLDYYDKGSDIREGIGRLTEKLYRELSREFSGVEFYDTGRLSEVFTDIYSQKGERFVILIDEWDGIFRNYPDDKESQELYLSFLRDWLKDRDYVALVYMTGILPVKKYGTHSALNMFSEYSMTDPRNLAPFFGFTEEEVKELCSQYKLDYEEMKSWYDGYELSYVDENDQEVILSIYNPKSVVEAISSRRYGSYWVNTESYEALEVYFRSDMDGLEQDIAGMIAGESVKVDVSLFDNSMTDFTGKDDIFTLLIHLGYLTYSRNSDGPDTVRIPNREVAKAFNTSIRKSRSFLLLRKVLENSDRLLKAIWEKNAEEAAKGIELAHEYTAILDYSNEKALKYSIILALFTATIDLYELVQEFPSGKGFADVVYLPRRGKTCPAIVMELKYDKSAQGAIRQIKERHYLNGLGFYKGSLLLCGINYDAASRTHECIIEESTL